MNDCRYYPTSEQLLAIEREARRLRAKVIADSIAAGANALKRWIVHVASLLAGVKRGAGAARANLTVTNLRRGS